MEILEKRLAPAGVITAILAGGTLKLIGDAADNGLTIRGIDSYSFELTGTDGTLIRLNGAAPVGTIIVAQVHRALNLDLRDGNDTLTLQDLSFGGSITAQMGAGLNSMELEDLHLGGSLTISGGAQDDYVHADSGDLRVGGNLNFALGAGGNMVALKDLGQVAVGGAVSFTGGRGWHDLDLTAQSVEIGRGLTMIAGAGSASLNVISEGSLHIGGSLHFQSAPHGEWWSAVHLQADVIAIDGGVQVRHAGYGFQTGTYMTATERLSVGGTVAISNSGASYATATELVAPVITIGGNLAITSGRGEKVTLLDGSVSIAGSATIHNAAGGGTTGIGSGDLEIGGNLTITSGAGVFHTNIGVGEMHIGGRLSVQHAGTFAAPFAGGSYIQADRLEAGSISIVNGEGNVSTTLVSSSGSTGAISITNGPTTPAGDSTEAGVTGTAILGHWQVDRDISIINGQGRYTGSMARIFEAEGRFAVGGAISVVTGAGSYGFHIDAGHLAARSLTIKSGDAAPGQVSNVIKVGSMDIAGALTITNGHAASHAYEDTIGNRIEVNGSAVLGSLTIRNGNGHSENVLAGGSVTVRGGVSITSGISSLYATAHSLYGDFIDIRGALTIHTTGGDTQTAITGGEIHLGRVSLNHAGLGGDDVLLGGAALSVTSGIAIHTHAGYPPNDFGTGTRVVIGSRSDSGDATVLDLLGGIRFTGAAEGLLNIHGDGRIAGGVTAQLGSYTSGVSISGDREHAGSLEVAGTVRISGSGASLHFADASFGAVSYRGGVHVSAITVEQAQFTGAVLLDCGAGRIYEATIDDSTFGGSLTIFGGASADTVAIETRDTLPGATTFHGPVKIPLGRGDDTLRLSGAAPAQQATFHHTATFDGGTGTNTFQLGPHVTHTLPPPAITNFTP